MMVRTESIARVTRIISSLLFGCEIKVQSCPSLFRFSLSFSGRNIVCSTSIRRHGGAALFQPQQWRISPLASSPNFSKISATLLSPSLGAIKHEDFEGHKGTIGVGDLQWMTAGRGILHSEMPAAQGTQKGLQLWINLSSKYKMIEPRYQEIASKDIAEASKDGVNVRVIAGEALGTKSPIYTRTPTMYLDFTLNPGTHLEQPIPVSWNAFVYVLEGEGVFGNSKSLAVTSHHLLLLGTGDGLEAWNKSSKLLRFILVGGEPLGEPVMQLGPFVMNTQEEIDQTIEDYESYINGFEKARHWRSEAILSVDH